MIKYVLSWIDTRGPYPVYVYNNGQFGSFVKL